MQKSLYSECNVCRREVLRAGFAGLALQTVRGLGLPIPFGHALQALAADDTAPDRILVVLELSGGNDGLNTLVPYGDDAYYRHRPTIGIKPQKLRTLDNDFGFSGGSA